MDFLETHCSFTALSPQILQSSNVFDCGNADLNDFFLNDCIDYSHQLIGKTYCFTLDENPKDIVCMFTISNDSIKMQNLPNNRKKKVTSEIPNEKRNLKSFPAVLIGRLGVNLKFAGKGIGTELMDFVKAWFVDNENKTGCRFIVVDAYNQEKTLNYYSKMDLFFCLVPRHKKNSILRLTQANP